MMSRCWKYLSLIIVALPLPVLSADYDTQCLLESLDVLPENTTIESLKQRCVVVEPSTPATHPEPMDRVKQRILLEHKSNANPFALTPHRPNYFLPFVYTEQPNEAPFDNLEGDSFSNVEFQFQVSLKALLLRDLLGTGASLSFGYTNQSHWQAYNSAISSPFRETNHEPELLLSMPSSWSLFGFENVANIVAFNHQSNGRTGDLSRSWNRVMLQSIWSKGDFAFHIRPWYRVPENEGDFLGDPSGDDNPDIEFFLGNFDIQAAYNYKKNHFGLMLRNNLRSDNRGAMELTWSYPIKPKIKVLIRYFNGYGDSLIDYNERIESLGVGFELSSWF